MKSYDNRTPSKYNDAFFEGNLRSSLESAKNTIPEVMRFIKPSSVIDIGCGVGAWLKVWKDSGVKYVHGVDGQYVKKSELLINENEFTPFELSNGFSDNRKYDLVSCLEVAEHIRAEFASTFVQSLCMLGDVVLFSAAIPGQGGTLHYNEKYIDYWINEFARNNYIPLDCLRSKIWNNPNIAWWYRQNILLFVNKSVISQIKELYDEFQRLNGQGLNVVHPILFEYQLRQVEFYRKTLQNPLRIIKYYVECLFRLFRK